MYKSSYVDSDIGNITMKVEEAKETSQDTKRSPPGYMLVKIHCLGQPDPMLTFRFHILTK